MPNKHMHFIQQPAANPVPDVEADDRHRQIAEAAYLRAQARGFAPGHELEDWLAAEQEFAARLGRKTEGA